MHFCACTLLNFSQQIIISAEHSESITLACTHTHTHTHTQTHTHTHTHTQTHTNHHPPPPPTPPQTHISVAHIPAPPPRCFLIKMLTTDITQIIRISFILHYPALILAAFPSAVSFPG